MRSAACPSPYSGGASAGKRAALERFGEPVRLGERVRAGRDGVDPLGVRAQRHARDAQPVRLLLQAAGVGDDDARRARRARASRDSRAARSPRRSAGSSMPFASSAWRVRGCTGKTNRRSASPSAATISPQPVGLGVRLAVDRQRGVRRRRGPRRRVCAIGAKIRVASAITSPTTSAFPPTPSDASCAAERSSGQRRSAREPVDLDAVPLLGHREVEAAQPGLDVCDADVAGGARTRDGRVRVAVDEHPVGPLAPRRRRRSRPSSRRCRPCAGRAGSAGSGMLELVEEDLRHLRVPVLARCAGRPRRSRRRAARA